MYQFKKLQQIEAQVKGQPEPKADSKVGSKADPQEDENPF